MTAAFCTPMQGPVQDLFPAASLDFFNGKQTDCDRRCREDNSGDGMVVGAWRSAPQAACPRKG